MHHIPVADLPFVIIDAPHTAVRAGDELALVCRLSYVPRGAATSYTWIRFDRMKKAVGVGSLLLKSDLQTSDAGDYMCEVQLASPHTHTVLTGLVTVTVLEPILANDVPIIYPPDEIEGQSDDNARVSQERIIVVLTTGFLLFGTIIACFFCYMFRHKYITADMSKSMAQATFLQIVLYLVELGSFKNRESARQLDQPDT
jgi:hypothetical protein